MSDVGGYCTSTCGLPSIIGINIQRNHTLVSAARSLQLILHGRRPPAVPVLVNTQDKRTGSPSISSPTASRQKKTVPYYDCRFANFHYSNEGILFILFYLPYGYPRSTSQIWCGSVEECLRENAALSSS